MRDLQLTVCLINKEGSLSLMPEITQISIKDIGRMESITDRELKLKEIDSTKETG